MGRGEGLRHRRMGGVHLLRTVGEDDGGDGKKEGKGKGEKNNFAQLRVPSRRLSSNATLVVVVVDY